MHRGDIVRTAAIFSTVNPLAGLFFVAVRHSLVSKAFDTKIFNSLRKKKNLLYQRASVRTAPIFGTNNPFVKLFSVVAPLQPDWQRL
jgi:hypothetical protein